MAALLVNIMAHDVTHDYNGGSSSTKRLVKLKNKIAEQFRLPQEEEPQEEEPQEEEPQATPVPRPRAPKGKRGRDDEGASRDKRMRVAAFPVPEEERAPGFGLVIVPEAQAVPVMEVETVKNLTPLMGEKRDYQMDVGRPITPLMGEKRDYQMDENQLTPFEGEQRTPFMLEHLDESEAAEPSSNVDPLDRPPTEEDRENMTDVESRHSDDFENSLSNWLGRVGRNLGRVTRAASVALDNLRQELEEATVYLLGEMAPRQGAGPFRQGGGADVIVDRPLVGNTLGQAQPIGQAQHPSGPVKRLSRMESYLKKRALDEQWEKEQAQREAMDEDTDEDTDEDQGKVAPDGPSPSVSGDAPVKKQVPVEYLNQYNFIAGALASPVRIFLDPEDPEDPEEPSMAEEALQIRQMMADIFHSLCESNPGMPPIALYTSLTYRTLIAFSLVTDDYKRPHEEQEIRGLFSSTGGAVRDQMSQQRSMVAQAELHRPMAAGAGPADATYVDYINDVSKKLESNEYTIESTVAKTRDKTTGGPMDKAAIEKYLNDIMNELLPSDKSMKPPTSAPNKVTAASFARMLGSKRANPGDARMQMVYDEFLGKFATNVAAQKANNDIQLDRYEAALERVQLGKDLSPQARGVVNGLSRAVIEGVLRQLPRKTPGNAATPMERGFHDLQYGIMEGARDTGSTSTIDENLYNGFINLLKNDPALLTREAALDLAKKARENKESDPLYKSFDTVNNASDLSHLYENDPAALLGKDKDDYTACTGASVADAMSYCSFTKAKDDKNLVLHDMVFQLGANNTGLNYTGYSTQAKKKDVYSVGFHIYVNENFVVGPTFKNVNLKTGKELSASSVYANVLNHIGTKMSWVASPEDVAAAFENVSILAEFLACICFKNTGDLFQEMNALLRYRGVKDPERPSLAEDPFMMFVGNDRPSSVRGMAMARMYEPGSAVNKNALMGYVSSGTQQFVRAQGTQGGARTVPQGGTNAKGNAKATRKSILKRSKNKTRARKKVRFTLRKSA